MFQFYVSNIYQCMKLEADKHFISVNGNIGYWNNQSINQLFNGSALHY